MSDDPGPNDRGPKSRDHGDCSNLTGLTLDYLPHASLGLVRRYEKGADVWRPDDKAGSIFFLQQGKVAVMMAGAEGHELTLRVIDPGEPFGELCFCSRQENQRQTCARAVVESEAREITLADLVRYLQENRNALMAFAFTFCMRLSDAEHRVEELAHRGAEERLGRLLLHLALSRGTPNAGVTGETALPVSQRELAQMAAMSRPHVNVTLGKFRRRDVVRYQRGGPIVVDVPAMKSYLTGRAAGRWQASASNIQGGIPGTAATLGPRREPRGGQT